MTDLKPIISKLATGVTLSVKEAETAFNIVMKGTATQAQIGGLLMALRIRGETVDEITGAVNAIRANARTIWADDDAIDIVGTGGDGKGSYNVSTGTALVVAGCGVPVAKHGNRALSSKSGAADVLKILGVNIDASPKCMEQAIRDAHIGFMFAPHYHAAMRHVAAPRTELATRTIFNLLGPLSNPAQVKRQFTGVFAKEWVKPLAHVLGNLGLKHAWVVHGSDGLDEITTTGFTYVAEYKNNHVNCFKVTPEDAGLPINKFEDLLGSDPTTNAQVIHDMLNGKDNAYRNIVLMNAAGSLIVAGRANSLKDGVAIAADSIDSGKAKMALAKLVQMTSAS